MDKYHIYEEVGSGQHSQVFKGREKMDIEYVAIKRVEKSRMESIVKEVQQVIHRLSSPNVLKFYDWYETRNNVWLILEFCTGGDLLTLIKQDHQEPESAVRLFGVDLLAGLQQTHACGYLHGDLRPSNVLIDEYGILKLSGFGLARGVSREDKEKGEGEASLEGGRGVSGDSNRVGGEDYSQHQHQEKQQHQKQQQQQQQGGASAKDAAAAAVVAEGRDPAYMAPELFSVGEQAMSFASDFWSLGCVLYELLTGEPPFRSSASATVAETIAREHPPGLDKGEWQGAQMSAPFRDLVSRLLDKDPRGRPTWPQLLAHPFWGNCQTPSPLEMPPQPRFDRDLAPCSGAVVGSSSAAVVTKVADDSCGRAAAAAVVGREEVRDQAASEARQQERQRGRERAEGAAEGGGGRGDFDRALGDIGIVEVIVDDASLSSSPSSSSFSRSSSSCSSSAGGLAGVSTIDSTSMRRRERRGMTGEWKYVSALSTDELPAEVVTDAEEDSCDGDEEGHRREREEDNDQWRHQREGGRKVPVKVRGALNVGGVRADFARHHTGREKEPGEGPELGLGGMVPPSTRSIPGTTATERWRSANQRRSPRDRETPLTAGQHGRDGCRLDKGADGESHVLVRAPVVSQGVTAGQGGRGGTALPPSVAVAPTASTSQVRPEGQQAAAAAAAVRRRAPCHDGLVFSRGCGETTTTGGGGGGGAVVLECTDSSSPGGISRGRRRRRRRENGAVDDDANGGGVSNSAADAADAAAAKRAAAAEALNGLRLRGRIPPVRRGGEGGGGGGGGGGGRGRGAAATRGRGAAAGGRKSTSMLSVAVSVASEASSSVGEQYGSSFEEDTEGSSSCSAAGRGGGGSGGGLGPESASVAP
ncbi:unnamed protein product, partial [Ectocarpus sp. 4 AP-2014]